MSEPIVFVRWVDADRTSGWHNAEDVAEVAPILSVGFLTRDNDIESFVVITQSLNELPDSPKYRTSRLGDSLTIPRATIRSVEYMQIARAVGDALADAAEAGDALEGLEPPA